MRVIGLTGGVGAGKTTILSVFEKKFSAQILICDTIADELLRKGQVAFEALVSDLGTVFLDGEGNLDKNKLAEWIFLSPHSEKAKKKIEQIVHPLVKEEVKKRLANTDYSLTIIESAILIESGFFDLCGEIWYVYASEKERVRRLQENRAYSLEKCRQIFRTQLTEEEFYRVADFVIDNTCLLSEKEIEQEIKKGLQR